LEAEVLRGKRISLGNLKITVEINIYGKKDGKKQKVKLIRSSYLIVQKPVQGSYLDLEVSIFFKLF
jgi:hypothetical protein